MERRRRALRCLLALAGGIVPLLGAPAAVPAPPAPPPTTVTARLGWEPGRLGPTTPMFVPFRPEVPKDAKPLSGLGDARYARIRWGEGPGLLLALDVAPGTERLWVDTDHDGDLEDETRAAWPSAGTAGSREEDVRVDYRREGAPEESTDVLVRLTRGESFAPDQVVIQPWVHRLGRVVLAGRLRAVALVDDNADLRFDDPERDRLFVDVDGDGSFASALDSHERIPLGTPFRVGDEGWQAEVPFPSGSEVRFTRTADVPPALPRAWPRVGYAAPPGQPQTPPAESYGVLAKRLEAERDLDYARRTETLQKLGRLGTPEAFDLLWRVASADANVSVQPVAARAMGNPAFLESRGAKVVELATTRSVSAAVSAAAVDALHAMGHPDRERIWKDLLGSDEASVAGAAARLLVQGGAPGGAEAVLAEWKRKPADPIRYQIYSALRSLPDGPPPAVVEEAASDAYVSLSAQALRDLLLLGHPKTREIALAVAARRPIPDYLATAVSDVLATFGDGTSVTALLLLAAETTPTVAVRVAQDLAPVRDPGGIAALLDALESRCAATRELASQLLSGIAEARVTESLLARAKKERDDSVLAAVLEALGDHPDPRSIDLLLEQSKRRKDLVRQAAIRALARVGLGVEKVRAFFVSLLGSKEWEDRVLALDAAAASGEVSLARKVAPNLAHEQRQVRLAAAEALGRLRAAEGIEPLIDRLEVEEEARVVDAIAQALHDITGMCLYDEPGTWRKWWGAEGKGFVPPADVKDMPPQDCGDTRVGFYGIPVRSGRVIFVIDQSGSMSSEDRGATVTGGPGGNRLDVAIREALSAVRGMGARDFANVILFHTTVQPWRRQLERLTKENRADLERHLTGQTPTGGTNLFDALEMALLDPEADTVFLLSDGMPGLGRFVATDDILRAVRRMNQVRRVAIHGVSIGLDSDLLRRLAAENGGQYVRR